MITEETSHEEGEAPPRNWKANAGAKGAELRGFAAAKAGEIRTYASDTAAQARDRLSALHEETEELIRANPNRSILIAFGAGVMVGLLLRK